MDPDGLQRQLDDLDARVANLECRLARHGVVLDRLRRDGIEFRLNLATVMRHLGLIELAESSTPQTAGPERINYAPNVTVAARPASAV